MFSTLDLLPYISSLLLAAISITNLFVPHVREQLTERRRTSVIIGSVLVAIGIGAIVSTSLRDKRVAQERVELNQHVTDLSGEVNTIIGQGKTLTDELKTAGDEARQSRMETRDARDETKAVRQELAKAQVTLSKDISASTGILSTNINQYRTDTSSAVSKILRPPRTIGALAKYLTEQLLKAPEPHEISFDVARGNQEALDLRVEIEKAFLDAGWKVIQAGRIIDKDANGLFIVVKKANEEGLTPRHKAVGLAFKEIGMQMRAWELPDSKEEGPVEIYVGLQ